MNYVVTITREVQSWSYGVWSTNEVLDRVVGPFATREEAKEWANKNVRRNLEHEIVELTPPLGEARIGEPIDLSIGRRGQ